MLNYDYPATTTSVDTRTKSAGRSYLFNQLRQRIKYLIKKLSTGHYTRWNNTKKHFKCHSYQPYCILLSSQNYLHYSKPSNHPAFCWTLKASCIILGLNSPYIFWRLLNFLYSFDPASLPVFFWASNPSAFFCALKPSGILLSFQNVQHSPRTRSSLQNIK